MASVRCEIRDQGIYYEQFTGPATMQAYYNSAVRRNDLTRDSGGCPGNAGDSEAGTFDMVRATWDSVNTYYIQLEERTGLDGPPLLAEKLGIRQVTSSFEGGTLNHYPSFVLGSANTVSPLAMAGAYAAFASPMYRCTVSSTSLGSAGLGM